MPACQVLISSWVRSSSAPGIELLLPPHLPIPDKRCTRLDGSDYRDSPEAEWPPFGSEASGPSSATEIRDSAAAELFWRLGIRRPRTISDNPGEQIARGPR